MGCGNAAANGQDLIASETPARRTPRGGLLGGWILSALLGIQNTGLIASFVVSLIGGCILVAIVHLVRREPIRS